MNKQTQLLILMMTAIWIMFVVVLCLTTSLSLSKILIDVTFAVLVAWFAVLLIVKLIRWVHRARAFITALNSHRRE